MRRAVVAALLLLALSACGQDWRRSAYESVRASCRHADNCTEICRDPAARRLPTGRCTP
jgi:hypothetical protein